MGTLTAEARERIRQARAAEVAAERAKLIRMELLQVCRGCGCDADLDSLAYTEGCGACWERRRARTDERRLYNQSAARKSYDRRRQSVTA